MTISNVLDLSALDTASRVLLSVNLKPVQGTRFQPTGFPDLGAATFVVPQADGSGRPALLVESAQSMANHLEAVCWDASKEELVDPLHGLSYVRVERDGTFLTSSVLEAHRLNSHYIEAGNKGAFHKALAAEIAVAKDEPIDPRRFRSTVLKYDVNSLVHGVFLESIDGRLRIARTLSSFIEADDVNVATSGGVKNDHVSPQKLEGKGAASGQGNVPFHREEYTARRITAYFSLDLNQIRGYGLGPDVEDMLIALALFKIRRLLDCHLRLRTACDLELVDQDVEADRPSGFRLPDAASLDALVRRAISACRDRMAGVTTVKYE